MIFFQKYHIKIYFVIDIFYIIWFQNIIYQLTNCLTCRLKIILWIVCSEFRSQIRVGGIESRSHRPVKTFSFEGVAQHWTVVDGRHRLLRGVLISRKRLLKLKRNCKNPSWKIYVNGKEVTNCTKATIKLLK